MESKNELKIVDIKNRTCFCFDDIITDRDIDFINILLSEKLYKKEYKDTLIYDVSYKTSMDIKQLRFMFHEIDGFIRLPNGEMKHLVLFDYWLFDKICDRIKYLKKKKSGITDSIIK